MCKLSPVLKEKIILWIIVNANNTNFALSLGNAFLHKRSTCSLLLYEDKEFHVYKTVAGFIEGALIFQSNV